MHLVVPDLRGVGRSAKPAHGYSLLDAAADVIALLDSLGIDTCWLIGTSSGGYLAQQIALDHPARVRGVVLIGSPSRLQLPPPAAFGELLASPHDRVTRADMDALNAAMPLHRPVPESFVEDQTTAALTIPKHVWEASLEGLLGAVPPIDRGTITAPTLILWGSEEDVLPPGQAGELRAAIEDSRLVVYEGTGHLVLWEQPERVATDVTAFIEGRSEPGTAAGGAS
jgi:rifampin ADP-ribosylating transferase